MDWAHTCRSVGGSRPHCAGGLVVERLRLAVIHRTAGVGTAGSRDEDTAPGNPALPPLPVSGSELLRPDWRGWRIRIPVPAGLCAAQPRGPRHQGDHAGPHEPRISWVIAPGRTVP